MELTVTYTHSFRCEFLAVRYWQAVSRGLLHYTKIVGMLLCATLIFTGQPRFLMDNFLMLVVAAGLFFMFDGVVMVFIYCRNKKEPWRLQPHECNFSPAGIGISAGGGRQGITWPACDGYREEKDCIILYYGHKGEYLAIPKVALDGLQQQNLQQLLETKTTPMKKVLI